MSIDDLTTTAPAAPAAPVQVIAEADPEHDTAVAAAAPPVSSGLYLRDSDGLSMQKDSLRFDVNGRDPQMAASGTVKTPGDQRLDWVARLTGTGPRDWEGPIWFRQGAALPGHTRIAIHAIASPVGPRRLRVTFTGGFLPLVHEYAYSGGAFGTVEFEFDQTADANPVYEIQTHAHPNHPADLRDETLTVTQVYRRAGFLTRTTARGPLVPTAGSGADALWSDTEMHDAMQAHWSRFADRPQWSMWVFHAALSDQGRSLGGIMFDSIGAQHRQGTAIFSESFISDPPQGDPDAAAAVARLRFWTMCHEMGHAFNLAHSWQKSLGTPGGWVPLQDAPEERSFMNYPFLVAGGATAFFADFEYRFSDEELLFLRHAPRRYVEMGNAEWFDHHGFEDADVSPEPTLRLVARLNRPDATLEFLEPAVIELKATNLTRRPVVVDSDLLGDAGQVTVVVKRDGEPAQIRRPFSTACREPGFTVLEPGESIYRSVPVGGGVGGWTVAEPGRYTVQARLRLASGEDVVSAPLRLRVDPPTTFDEHRASYDLFTEDVARTLAFDGTRELTDANDVLRDVADRLPERRVALHAQVALGSPMTRNGKILTSDGGAEAVSTVPARPQDARSALESALLTDRDAAADTLGNIGYRARTEALAHWLAGEGETRDARDVLTGLGDTLDRRGVTPAVVSSVRSQAERMTTSGEAPKRRSGNSGGAKTSTGGTKRPRK